MVFSSICNIMYMYVYVRNSGTYIYVKLFEHRWNKITLIQHPVQVERRADEIQDYNEARTIQPRVNISRCLPRTY